MSKTRTKQQNGGKGGFRETFASARKAGKKTFAYRGKKYTTQTAEEEAKTLSTPKLYSKWGQGTGTKKEAKGYEAYRRSPAGGSMYKGKSSKSEHEIEASRRKELMKRVGNKLSAYGRYESSGEKGYASFKGRKIKDSQEPMKEVGWHLTHLNEQAKKKKKKPLPTSKVKKKGGGKAKTSLTKRHNKQK